MKKEDIQLLVYNYIYLRNEWKKPKSSWSIYNAAYKKEIKINQLKKSEEFKQIIDEILPDEYKSSIKETI
jgi:hypothetical protein